MDSTALKKLIKITDYELAQYANDFNSVVKPIESIFNFATHNTNEFTNVYVAKKVIERYLTLQQGCKIAVRELPIIYSYGSSVVNSALKDAPDVVKHTKKFKKDGYFSVDSYFDVDINVRSNDEDINNVRIKYLFVEYKSSNVFKYVLLADDFIKYKIYTNNHENGTCFAFVNFDKNPIYPTILKKGLPDYILLPKILNKALFSADDRVFIYIPRNNGDISKQLPIERNNFKKAYRLIEEVEKIIDNIDENDIEERKHIALNDDFYVNNIGAFKNGVTTAELLLGCYSSFISKIYNRLKDLIIINNFDKQSLKIVKNDFFKYEKEVYGDKRYRSLTDGLNTGYKSSLNILVLFNFLNVKYNLGLRPALKSFESEAATGTKTINYNQILDNNTSILVEFASKNDYIDALSLNLLSFIHNLYEKILDFDSEGNYSYKDEYLLIKKTNKLQKNINELSSLLNIRKDFNIYGEHIKEDGVLFFKQIYNLLNGYEQ